MHPTPRLAAALLAGSGLGWPLLAQADLVEDSHASLELRNFYFNRDFRQSGARDNADEWAQGFLLRLESGFSEGTVGFGVDAIGLLGFKLDSGGGSGGTGLLPADGSAGGSQDDYAKLGLTAKARVSNSLLKVGALHFKSPLVSANDTRLLPELFRGALLDVQEIDGLTLRGAHLDRNKLNSSSDYQVFSANRIGGRSDAFDFAGGDYRLTPALTASLHQGRLKDIYRQTFAGLVHTLDLGGQRSLKSDLRFARASEDGGFRDLDNRAFGALFSLRLGAHAVAAGYQRISGDDPYPYIAGSDPYLVNFIQIGDFGNVDEPLLATALRLRFRRARPARPELHEPLRLRRQRRPQRGQRRQGMGTQHRPRLRGAERAAEEPRSEMAQRHGAFEFRQRPRRKPPDPQLQPGAVVRSGEQ